VQRTGDCEGETYIRPHISARGPPMFGGRPAAHRAAPPKRRRSSARAPVPPSQHRCAGPGRKKRAPLPGGVGGVGARELEDGEGRPCGGPRRSTGAVTTAQPLDAVRGVEDPVLCVVERSDGSGRSLVHRCSSREGKGGGGPGRPDPPTAESSSRRRRVAEDAQGARKRGLPSRPRRLHARARGRCLRGPDMWSPAGATRGSRGPAKPPRAAHVRMPQMGTLAQGAPAGARQVEKRQEGAASRPPRPEWGTSSHLLQRNQARSTCSACVMSRVWSTNSHSAAGVEPWPV